MIGRYAFLFPAADAPSAPRPVSGLDPAVLARMVREELGEHFSLVWNALRRVWGIYRVGDARGPRILYEYEDADGRPEPLHRDGLHLARRAAAGVNGRALELRLKQKRKDAQARQWREVQHFAREMTRSARQIGRYRGAVDFPEESLVKAGLRRPETVPGQAADPISLSR